MSYNVLPGCFVRQIAWDAIKVENAGSTAAPERLAGARRIGRDLAESWSAAGGASALLAPEFARDAERADGALYEAKRSGKNCCVTRKPPSR